MTKDLKIYHETHVIPCRRCEDDPTVSLWVTLEKPVPYQARPESQVLIVGHSPSVRTGKDIRTGLDLDRRDNLYRYLAHEVLEPLGLSLEQCPATNLVKCFTHRMPEDLESDRIRLMGAAFAECSQHFEEEVRRLQPRLVISLSERVLKLLSERYLNLTLSMKAAFGSLLYLPVGGVEVAWIPVVHLPKPNSKVRKHYFPAQTERLHALRASVQSMM